MNLSDIKAQFLALANRRDLTANTALTQTFIDQGIMRIQRELRIPAMEKSVLVTIADNYAGLVIPSDFLELIRLVPEGNDKELTKCDLTRALWRAKDTANPEEYARQGGLWVLGPSPGVGDVIRIDYWCELSPLVNPTDSNVVSTIAWDLIMYAALIQMAVYFKDDRKGATVDPMTGKVIDGFEGEYNRIFNDLQDQADQDETNGDAQVMPTYAWPEDQ